MEQALERFQQGGFINGDYVKISKKITNSPYFKNAPAQTQEYIQNCIDTDEPESRPRNLKSKFKHI